MVWRVVPGRPLLFADESGWVATPTPTGMLHLTQRTRDDGYVTVKHEGETLYVHRLVCAAWRGPAPTPMHEADHDNGLRGDNRPDNLLWRTKKENLAKRLFRWKRERPPASEPTHPRLLDLWRRR